MTDEISIENKKELIKKQGAFSSLNDSEIDVLVTLLVEKRFAPGDIIVKQGDRVDSVYIIVSGSADVLVTKRENNQSVTEKVFTLTDGKSIGLNDRGFYSITGLRTATVKATTEVVTLKLSVAMFRGFALAYPHASEVMREQAARL
ncbi:MAG TPA: cyclic nucleotide-binding domain-containing protein [Gammaproteobacteria bacterium]|nr:cyclic nucleotide-binding domain-containing protein [Gammaproteobacteria bacterium]